MTQLDLLGAVIFFQDAFHYIEKRSDLNRFPKRLNEQKTSVLSWNIEDASPDDESRMSLSSIDRAIDLLANLKREHIKHLVPVLSAIFAITPKVYYTDDDEHLLVFTPVEDFTADSEWAKWLVNFFNKLISNRRVVGTVENFVETICCIPLMREIIITVRYIVRLRKSYENNPLPDINEEDKRKFTKSLELLEQTLATTIDSLSQENGVNFDLFLETLPNLSSAITELSFSLNQISKILEDELNKQRLSRSNWSLGKMAGMLLTSASLTYGTKTWSKLSRNEKILTVGLGAVGVGTVVACEYMREDLKVTIENHIRLSSQLHEFNSVLNEMGEYTNHNLIATNSNLKIREINLIGSFQIFQKKVKETRQSLERGNFLPSATLQN
ncbi:hypothetical protein G9A89_017870 [Geosiphon pyriformis]|nr:hypothetical protein G9A89_017870 [Geosiphon pyriformis]